MTVEKEFGFEKDDQPVLDSSFSVSSTIIPGIVLLIDAVMVMIAAVGSLIAYPVLTPESAENYVFCIGFVLMAVLVLHNRAGLYDIDAIMRPVARADCVVIAVATSFLLFLTIAFSLKVSEEYSRLWMFSFGGSAIVLLIAARMGLRSVAGLLSRRGVVGRNLVVLGDGEQARQFLLRLRVAPPHFTQIRGLFSPAEPTDSEARLARLEGEPVLGGPDALVEAARRGEVDDIVVAMPWQEDETLTRVIGQLRELPVNIFISTDLIGYHMRLRPAEGEFHNLPLFEVVQRPISGWSALAKRIEDLVLGTMILLLLLPFMLLVALAVKLDSRGPVFFKQRRLGFNNQEFEIYKFRSMYHDAKSVDENGVEKQATKDDDRITRVGRIIRRLSIDELPQLLNVIGGSMSLVGPRPHAISHNEEYAQRIRGYFARHRVKPGITGWAQVNGLRGETARLGLMRERVRYDTYYADNWSVLFDLRILLMTALVVLFQKSAY